MDGGDRKGHSDEEFSDNFHSKNMSDVEITLDTSNNFDPVTTSNNPFFELQKDNLEHGTSQELFSVDDCGRCLSGDSTVAMDTDSGIETFEMEDSETVLKSEQIFLCKRLKKALFKIFDVVVESPESESENNKFASKKLSNLNTTVIPLIHGYSSELAEDKVEAYLKEVRDLISTHLPHLYVLIVYQQCHIVELANLIQCILCEICALLQSSGDWSLSHNGAADSLCCSPTRDMQTFPADHPLICEFDVATTNNRDNRLFVFLISCYERLQREKEINSQDDLIFVFEELDAQIVSFIAFLLQGYLSVEQSSAVFGSLVFRSLVERSLPYHLFQNLVSVLMKNASFEQVFKPVLDSLFRVSQRCSLTSETFRDVIALWQELIEMRISDPSGDSSNAGGVSQSIRPFCTLIIEHFNWLPTSISDAVGREFSHMSLLGPLLSLSTFGDDDPRIVEMFFYEDMQEDSAKMQYSLLRQRTALLRGDMHQLFHKMLAYSKSRDAVLDYIAAAIDRNRKKAQTYVEPSIVAGHGFTLNMLSVMYLLSVKITLDKVNPNYVFHQKSRLQIEQEARLKLKPEQLQPFLDSIDHKFDVKFPTECFFLTMAMQHVALTPALRNYSEMHSQEIRLRRAAQGLEQTRSQWPPMAAARNEVLLRRHLTMARRLARLFYCVESNVLDEVLLGRALTFSSKMLCLLVDLLSPKGSNLPILATQVPPVFGALPEYFLEDILDLIIFILQNVPGTIVDSCPPELPNALMVLVCSPQAFNKPFLAARLVETLFSTCLSQASYGLHLNLLNQQVSIDHLFLSLVKFYVDCEYTGSHTEFYDKFNIRYHTQVIFKQMWRIPLHRSIMIDLCNACGQEFIRFINMLINDTTFLLDEVLEGLKKIHDVQSLMDNQAEWDKLTRSQQKEKREFLQQFERVVPSYLQLTRETMELLLYLSEKAPEPFLSEQLCERLAAMLNYNLGQLCGPKCSNLKVRNAEKYNFEPKKLLDQLTDIYLHLDDRRLARCIAADERSYQPDLMKNCIGKLRQYSIKSEPQIERFQLLAEQAAAIWRKNLEREEAYGEIPDEFQDPIMGTLMKDPVRLPSGHIVDRPVILRHLLSDQSNPFNREKMAEEDLKDDDELKNRINVWVKERRGK